MAEKEKAVVPEIIDNVEALEAKMKAMRCRRSSTM